jgi:poly-gamma-glutamate synthase PgsB/CapB
VWFEAAAFLTLLLLLGALGMREKRRHARHLASIPIRILVNGSRGKSTVTRLVAAALREAGLRAVARTTGTAARLILEDGSEEEIRRPARPRLAELLATVEAAARRGAQALVVECMAIQPELQWIAEHRMIRSTVGVITNVRDDHLEVMGPTLEDAARALCRTIPRGGELVTAESDLLPLVRAEAEKVGARVLYADPQALGEEARRGLSPLDFAENVALALRVGQVLGIPPGTALRGMLKSAPDPGGLNIYRWSGQNKSLVLVNGFAANDPTSTEMIMRKLKALGHLDRPLVVLYNHRPDRVHRSLQFCRFLARVSRELDLSKVVSIGPLSRLFFRQMRRLLPADRLADLGAERSPGRVMEAVAALAPAEATVLGIGNIGGIGLALVESWARAGVSRG